MSTSRPNNKADFVQYIKSRLGGDFVRVELSDNNYDMIIQDALLYCCENVAEFTYTGLVKLETSYPDVEYTLANNIYSVSEILDQSIYSQIYFQFPTRDKSPAEISLITSFGGRGAGRPGLLDMTMFLQNMSAFKTLFIPKSMYEFKPFINKLILHSDIVDIELGLLCKIMVDADATGTGGYWNHNFFKNYATCLAKLQWAQNISKFSGLNIPGGGSLNAEAMKTDALAEKTALELYANESLADFSIMAPVIG